MSGAATRYRVKYRWFRPPLIVLQVSVQHTGSFCGEIEQWMDWRDARPDDLINQGSAT